MSHPPTPSERARLGQVEREETKALHLLFNIASMLTEPGAFTALTTRMLEEVSKVLEVDSADLRMPDVDQTGLRVVASVGSALQPLGTFRSFGDSRTGRVFQLGKPIIAHDYGVNHRGGPDRGRRTRLGYEAQSVAWFPVKSAGRTVSVLTVDTVKLDHFTAERVRLLTAVADGIGAFIENANLRETERIRVQELEVLHRAASILSGRGSFEARVRSVLKEVVKVAGDWATLRVPEAGGQHLRLVAATRSGSRDAVDRSASLSGEAFDRKRPAIVNDYKSYPDARPQGLKQGIRSEASFPVMVGGKALAAITIGSRTEHYFTPERVMLLSAIAAGIGPHLEHARLEEEAREQAREGVRVLEQLQTLVTVTGVLVESGDFDERITRVLEELGRVLGADDVVLRRWDEAKGGLVRVASADAARRASYPVPVRALGEGLSGRAFQTGETQVSNEYATDTDAIPAIVAEGVKAVASFPIKVEGNTLGTITLNSHTSGFFTPERLWLISAVVDGTGVLMEQARLQEVSHQRDRERSQALEQLQITQQQLVQSGKLAAIGELVAGVAHEINNPLTGILGHTQLLLRGELDATTKESLEVVEAQTKRVARIVQNLLSFASQRKPERAAISINDLVERTLELRNYDLNVNNIEVSLDLDPASPAVWGDMQQLEQVFLNIVNNAQQAMAAAHGKGRLAVKTQISEDKVLVTLTDDGPGIPAKIIERIFDPFFTTKGVGEGTGLGLSICYGIVAEHGGRLWAESSRAKGSSFQVEFPLARVSPASVPRSDG